MVLDHEGGHPLRWAAIVSISEKIGCGLVKNHKSEHIRTQPAFI
jgi:hypothetical protein